MRHWILSALVGWGLASWVLMRVIWLPDPPPDAFGKFITTSIAGIVGGLLGGAAVGTLASDPMPGVTLVGALAGAMVVVAGLRALSPRSGSGR